MGIGGSKEVVDEGDRVLLAGKPDYDRCDNMITTSRYTPWNFLFLATIEQFRRFANMYFLIVGGIMAVGYYTDLFESAISPWTTLGPLSIVISFSLLVEGTSDSRRHRSDEQTNHSPCVILRRADELDADENAERDKTVMNSKDVLVNLSKAYFQTSNNQHPETPVNKTSSELVGVAFQQLRRMDIRQGHLVLIKNRDMVPADMILLASSGDSGSSYIETSSIDGETNLKLRTSPHLPKKLLKHLRDGIPMDAITEEPEDSGPSEIETLEQATKRVTRFSCLANPEGISALENPNYDGDAVERRALDKGVGSRRSFFQSMDAGLQAVKGMMTESAAQSPSSQSFAVNASGIGHKYVAALTTEAPNPHVNTFSGKLTLPPVEIDGSCYDIPLGAENILLRGAVLRNTEWAIGLACFTGTDTKLVQNSFETPSKFSQLDRLMNSTVIAVICLMILCISYLATQAVISNDQTFDDLWYVGLNSNKTEAWPYLADLDPPDWDTTTPNWLQMFFLYVTLLSNFIPLSMYVTVEATNFFFLWLIYVDLDLYDATTDTRGLARSTNVTDLGQIQYIFSDKTGTLTQNVMRFKRCSVDGMAFGAPIQKVRPGAEEEGGAHQSSFHPLRQLMVGRVKVKETSDDLDPLAGYSTTAPSDPAAVSSREGQLTFNSEMFLRVLSLCHTVVVEKDLDLSDNIDSGKSVSSQGSSWSGARNYAKKLFGSGGGARNRTMSDGSAIMGSPLGAVPEDVDIIGTPGGDARMRTASTGSYLSSARPMDKGPDGSPAGFAYQAESPDEGALVSAASQTFGFQVIGRDSSGIKIRSPHPTILRDEKIVKGLKSGALTPKSLAAATSAGLEPVEGATNEVENIISDPSMQRIETWTILAVNKFDSDRKRMSILLRSPHELGDIPILFCKGADSAMLDPEVCSGAESLVAVSSEHPDMAQQQMLDVVAETSDGEDFTQQDEWELAQMLGIQSHLGEFASEGLRTLVLGVRFLTENECTQWLETYNDASTSIKNRDQKLTDAALQIERKLHIVGATAIEDKLQVGVPKTIATLAKAGIKLWVLTGDKRETAIEIGYSTAVLTPKMHLTEVADKGPEYVRAQCAMEFIRLVKAGKLPKYQRAAVDKQEDGWSWENFMFAIGKANRRMSRMFRRCIFSMQLMIGTCFGADPATFEAKRTLIEVAEEAEKGTLRDTERRRRVRDRAEKIIKDYLESPEGQKHRKPRQAASPAFDGDGSDHLSLSSDEVPGVFNRAQSARLLLDKHKTEGKLSSSEIRSLSLAQLTAQQMEDDGEAHLIDEDTLSLNSFFPNTDVTTSDFDKKKRTLLERLFAVDKEVRRGRLIRHMKKDKRVAALASPQSQTAIPPTPAGEGPRALVIEGAALKYLLGGEPELEELIFSVASSCDAVIACRVSPRQKALLVNLVRHNVFPEPVTLAIGDGANDVGMIQEAHVGVGISGKEGTQAVNASDFAIAQFRFLEDLVLVHGRWNFFRLSTVVLFSFYKNAVMAGCLVVFNGETVFSGTPLFDEWVIAMLNFVAGIPILVLGLFDRCLEKDYVRKNPEVYQATRDNELITRRVLIRWVLITFTHIFVLYYCIVPQLSEGGGMTTAFVGLMRGADSDTPGEGEGGDLQSVGSIVYTCMILILAYKVLYESKSPIHGRWPAFTCRKDVEEGFFSRLGYTWIGITYCSILFWFFFIGMYHIIGETRGAGQFFNFVGVTPHILGTRSVNWMIIFFVPILGMALDVAGKVFSNMFYPTQTQIHIELEVKERVAARKLLQQEGSGQNETPQTTGV